MPDNILSNLLRSKIVLALIYLTALALLVYASAFAYQRYQEVLGLKAVLASAAQPLTGVAKDKPTVSGTRQVAALSLFGKKAITAEPVAEVIDAPITRLKLTLLGAIAADDTEKSSAFIQIDNKQLAVVQVGDPLPGTNAKIHQIQPTQVVLMRNGKLERLAIIRPELEMNDQDDISEIVINSSGSAGNSLLAPVGLPRVQRSIPAVNRSSPKLNSRKQNVTPAFSPTSSELPPLKQPPRQ